jgi:hypothetical protein
MLFGHLGGNERVVYAIGYSGNGVGPSHLAGKILASLALDRKDEWSTNLLVDRSFKTFPPEPARFFGGTLVRAAVAAKERGEEEGRVPNELVRRLAALAPSGMQKGAQPKKA